MTANDIIQKFELYVDDTTELSAAEELALLNKIYQRVCDERVWEFLKKEATGSVSGTFITLPSDFAHLIENNGYTDNSMAVENNARPVAVYINNQPIQVVNWSDRKQYLNDNYVAYLDIANSKIVFPYTKSGTYSFDYKAFPANLEISGTPIFPARFHDILYHGMAVDDMIIQLFPKAQSYQAENQAMYNSYLTRMTLWNAKLNMM